MHLTGTSHSYVESLYEADSFETAFKALENQSRQLGFESVLYTYIPKVLIESNFAVGPVYKTSDDYSPGFLKHYAEKRFDKHDPLIRAVDAGINKPIDWHGDICRSFMNDEAASAEVIETASRYGIKSGITLPLLSGKHGIAGASFINTQKSGVGSDDHSQVRLLVLSTKLFHGLVQSNPLFKGEFVKTLLESLSNTERRFLAGLARGHAPSEIAYDLKTTERYLEQVMLKIRRKFSGVGHNEPPTINRNQLLYYAGLLDILEHVD